ncbi:MAG: T9SS type A sorting domain-containing protein, partial [Bacteroidales bacterium]|nr:T9SS type A sorting domain-containing protein [Bacteroidales bacterium]
AGAHTFTWAYEKDGSVTSGDDCVYLDNIIFPAMSFTKGMRSISIDATTIPAWLSFTDNGDGTGLLSGTSPAANQTDAVVLSATDGTNTVDQNFNISVGVNNVTSIQNMVSLYPNPTAKILNIAIDEFNTASFVLTDLVGKVIFVEDINSTKTQVDLSNLANGVYILNLNIDGTVMQEKIIVE